MRHAAIAFNRLQRQKVLSAHFNDLALLLADWGPCDADCCPADLDFDGAVGITDLLALLAASGRG